METERADPVSDSILPFLTCKAISTQLLAIFSLLLFLWETEMQQSGFYCEEHKQNIWDPNLNHHYELYVASLHLWWSRPKQKLLQGSLC